MPTCSIVVGLVDGAGDYPRTTGPQESLVAHVAMRDG
jgi:hypothetical protein